MTRVARLAIWSFWFGLELLLTVVVFFAATVLVVGHRQDVVPRDTRIAGNATAPPRLAFACELPTAQLQSLFAQEDVVQDLRRLNASVSLSLMDLSPGRAAVVRRLNETGIPVTAWMALPKEQGYYLNADNIAEASDRFTAFEKWTSDYGLRWDGIGLDIEPALRDFESATQGHPWRVVEALVRRCFDFGRVGRARSGYAALIRRMQADGYRVDTYQFPFIADERKVGAHLLERLFGIVDVRGNREVFMTYTSFNHTIDSALIWAYGPEAQLLAVGSTAGDPHDPRFRPLDWDEFSRDLIVAAHFSPVVGIYSLEGCVRQGFLPRLATMNWGECVTVATEAQTMIMRLRTRLQSALWTASHLLYFAVALALLNVWLLWRRSRKPRVGQPGAIIHL